MIIDVAVRAPASPDLEGSCDRFSELAERAGIERLVLHPGLPSGPPAIDELRAANDRTLAWVARRPHQCLGLALLDPRLETSALADEWARCAAQGLCGLALDPNLAGEAPCDDVADLAAAVDRPVRIALGPAGAGVRWVADLAARRPELRLLVAGLLAGGERAVADVCALPNVAIDTSGIAPIAGLIDLAVHELGEERVLFGSGAPERDFAVQLEQIHGAYLSLRQERRVLGGNAARQFGLRESGG